MSFSRSLSGASPEDPRGRARADLPRHEERRVAAGTRLASGTLACARCDAPVALAARPHSPLESLACPFCGNRAPLREFLSLAAPTRPNRVTVHVRHIRARRD